MNDTITACSTALPGAIAIIRISGKDAKRLLFGCFSPHTLESHKIMLGTLNANGIRDKAMATFFAAPKTYTGEDMAEIYIHGSRAVATALIKHLTENGARPAENGEFSKRAFLNGKLDLSSAEGIVALINSETAAEANAAYSLMNGELKDEICRLQAQLKDIIAKASAAVDYPEEDLEGESRGEILDTLKSLECALKRLKNSFKEGRLVKNGVKIAVCGGVNVGKSSLVNALLEKNRAIVTDIPGTTRDTLEDAYEYRGYKFVITDTAGIRQTSDQIEEQGIERAKQAAASSDILIFVRCVGSDEVDISALLKTLPSHIKVIEVLNKIDFLPDGDSELHKKTQIAVSALKKINIDLLRESIYNAMIEVPQHGLILTEFRHLEAVTLAYEAVCQGIDNIDSADMDCLLSLFHAAYGSLGAVTGEQGNEKIVEEIFSKFCVGK